MPEPITLKLPLPPTINHYYSSKVIKKNGKYIPMIYVQDSVHLFRKQVVEITCQVISEPLLGRIAINVVIHPKSNRTTDIDNHIKGLLDALTKAAVWTDDSQVDKITIERGRPINGGLCVIEILEVAG